MIVNIIFYVLKHFLLIDLCVEATICSIARYLTCGSLCLLILWDFLQLLSRILAKEFFEYFSWQNVIEVVLLSLSSTFLIIEFVLFDKMEYDCGRYSGLQMHLLGWALFLAWIDLTLFLGRFDIFGKHIYRSWHVMKNVAWSMTVYIPILLAFASAFHCFLKNDGIFEGTVASVLKVLTMYLGEFNFEGHFVYDKVNQTNGSQVSVQIMFIMFIILGSMIIVNLITAWIVVNQKDESDTDMILAKQRIQEISGIPKVFNSCSGQKDDSMNVPPTLLISSSEGSKDSRVFFRVISGLKKWFLDFSFDSHMITASALWEIETDDLRESMKKQIPPYVSVSLIDLTIKRLEMKQKKRLELRECIKQIQDKGGYKTCGRCLQPVPEGFTLEYVGLKSKTDGKVTQTFVSHGE